VKKLIVAMFVVVFAAAWATDVQAQDEFKWYWKDGLRFDAGDDFKFKMGGRVQNTWLWHSGDDDLEAGIGDLIDGTEFRRARFYVSGSIYGNTFFKAQYDFAGGDADFKDVYIGWKKVPMVGNFMVGSHHVPFGLETQTSSKYLTFVERSALTEAFAPERETGFKVYDKAMDGNLNWAFGVYRDADSDGDDSNEGEFLVAGRLAYVAWENADDNALLHVGFSVMSESHQGDSTQTRARPSTHLGPRFVDTGSFEADSSLSIGIEAALVYGPWSVQLEWMQQDADSDPASDPTFDGFYLFGSYFLTGENRKYKGGNFSRVKPTENFGWGEGKGAWELTARFQTVDLEDITGAGEMDIISVGVNWYLTPNTKVMTNYQVADLDRGATDGDSDSLQMMFHIDW
jgi:phosphate-selective porin OprO/OprP